MLGQAKNAGGQVSGNNDGTGTNAKFTRPAGIAYSPDGVNVLVSDYNNNLIRQIAPPPAQPSSLTKCESCGNRPNECTVTCNYMPGFCSKCNSYDGTPGIVCQQVLCVW